MRALGPPVREIEGRSGLTIDAREGGRYLGIPPQSPIESVTINLVSTKSGAVHSGLFGLPLHKIRWFESEHNQPYYRRSCGKDDRSVGDFF